MKKIRLLSVFNTIALVVHVFIAYSTQFKLINDQDVGEVSNKYSSLFTPAPITFAIWGVIYVSLTCFCIYHLIQAWKKPATDNANTDIQMIGPWFIINNLVTAAWLILWTSEKIGLSVISIFIQLICLIVINIRLHIYDRSRNAVSKTFTQFPLSIYFGWITIATIANVSSYLARLNWNAGISEVNWAVIMISIAVLLSLAVIITRKNVFYGIVVIWALYGIRQERLAPGNSNSASADYQSIITTTLAGIVIVSIACILQTIRNARQSQRAII